MKRKLVSLFFSLFLVFAVWAKGPDKNFPYVYHDKEEGYAFSSFGLDSYNKIKTVKNDDNQTVTLYRSNNIDYIVFSYKKKAPGEREIKDMLKNAKEIWKIYDQENGSPGVCLIFLDNQSFVFSARYSEAQ